MNFDCFIEEYNKLMNPQPVKTKELVKEQITHEKDAETVTELSLEDINKNEAKSSTSTKNLQKPKIKKVHSQPVKSEGKPNHIIIDEATNFEYEKLKMGDAKFSSLMVSIKSRKYRQQSNQILLEGRRLIEDALEADLKLQKLMFSKVEYLKILQNHLKNYERDPKCMFYKVPHGDMAFWSNLTTNPGIMGLFTRPPQYYIPQKVDVTIVPLTVICDNIREPTNMGSIIRTCAAIPCHQLLLTKGKI